MNKQSLLFLAIALATSSFAYGQQPPAPPAGDMGAPPPQPHPNNMGNPLPLPVNIDVNNTDQTQMIDRNVSAQTIRDDMLRKQQLSEQEAISKKADFNRYTGRQLVENPAILEGLLVDALVLRNKPLLPTLMELYKLVPNRDESLLDWGQAIMLTDKDLSESVSLYRKLISHFPTNNFIRFQLAETLFYNQEYEASRDQFERIRSSNVTEKDIQLIDRYIESIDSKDKWNFYFSGSFLRDRNLGNAAEPGTQMALPYGTFTYNTPRQKGNGVYLSVGTDKRWSLNNGKYLVLHASTSGKYYWNNKYYNDFTSHLDFGMGYSNARFNFEITPYAQQRWYSGGVTSSESLKRYSNTYGLSTNAGYWLSQNFKYNVSYNFGYEKYNRERYALQYDGALHYLSNGLMYLPSPTQFWQISFDLMYKDAANKVNAYNRVGGRLMWGQDWLLGFATTASIGYAKKYYKAPDFFGYKQKSKEYNGRLSIWHKKLHFAGFTPKLTWSYSKTSSNVPIYSYDKSQVFLDISKTF